MNRLYEVTFEVTIKGPRVIYLSDKGYSLEGQAHERILEDLRAASYSAAKGETVVAVIDVQAVRHVTKMTRGGKYDIHG